MLNRTAIQSAFPIAQALASRGISVTAAGDTPIHVLTETSRAGADLKMAHAAVIPGLESYDVLLERSSQSQLPDGSYPHDDRKAESIENVTTAVLNGLNVAQNQVNPKIKRVVDEVNSYVDADEAGRLQPMNVVPVFYHEIWDSPIVEQLAGRHANQYHGDFKLRALGLPVPSDWSAVLKSGVPSLDAELSSWVASLNPSLLQQVWEETFGLRANSLLEAINGRAGTGAGLYARLEAPLVVFLAARFLADNVPEGANMSLDAYRLYMAELAARAGQNVMSNLHRRATDIRRGVVIISVPPTGTGDVHVLGDTYNQFLANGGSPEAVLGAVVSQRPQAITTAGGDFAPLVAEWNRVRGLIANTVQYRRRELIVNGLKLSLLRLINDAEDAELPPGVDRSVFHQRLGQQIAELRNFRQEDLYAVARSLICRILYAHTDAELILSAIDNAIETASRAGAQMDVREAALLGVIDYLVEWAVDSLDFSQITVS